MAVSPFTFYRGAAKIMAADLATTPASGMTAQICGDAHLSNFGTFASPEREQVFDINDFDETLPGPWEWDLKRLATSFVLAGRDNEFGESDIRAVTTESVAGYRRAMASMATGRTLDVWYQHLTLQQIADGVPRKKTRDRVTKLAAKARSKNSLKAKSKLTYQVDGRTRIKSQPPLLIPLRDLDPERDPDELEQAVDHSFSEYRATLQDNRRRLLDQYRLIDVALKVVGVGSVGTRCAIVLLEGKDSGDPLFLQMKEATASVLEDQLPKSAYSQHGERVVQGQRLMQSASDIFLGWSKSVRDHEYYWRQFHDMKGSVDIASMSPNRMTTYATICGWTLAHAHARSGVANAISGYLGSGDVFDRAVAEFGFSYAEQSQRDFEAFTEAIASGRIEAQDD